MPVPPHLLRARSIDWCQQQSGRRYNLGLASWALSLCTELRFSLVGSPARLDNAERGAARDGPIIKAAPLLVRAEMERAPLHVEEPEASPNFQKAANRHAGSRITRRRQCSGTDRQCAATCRPRPKAGSRPNRKARPLGDVPARPERAHTEENRHGHRHDNPGADLIPRYSRNPRATRPT